MAAVLGVLGSGLLRGVLIGAIISIIQLLRRASHPHVAFLGRIPGTRRYSDLARHEDNEPVPGMLICRPESPLLYFNIDHVRDTVTAAVQKAPTPVNLVLLDLSAAPHVDLQAAQTLASLHADLKSAGSQFQIVEARASVRDTLRLEGLEEKVGRINRFTTVSEAVDEFLGSHGHAAAAAAPKVPAPA
jgi:MFS superfamily sulfate permease-like transporter